MLKHRVNHTLLNGANPLCETLFLGAPSYLIRTMMECNPSLAGNKVHVEHSPDIYRQGRKGKLKFDFALYSLHLAIDRRYPSDIVFDNFEKTPGISTKLDRCNEFLIHNVICQGYKFNVINKLADAHVGDDKKMFLVGNCSLLLHYALDKKC